MDSMSIVCCDGTWWVLQSTGSSFDPTVWADFTTASGWQHRMVGDFNGDGKDDIAQYNPFDSTWWIGGSTGRGFTTSQWAAFTPFF